MVPFLEKHINFSRCEKTVFLSVTNISSTSLGIRKAHGEYKDTVLKEAGSKTRECSINNSGCRKNIKMLLEVKHQESVQGD